ncbi:hypothetical protein BDY21DRAFT_354389 [Lineolata rhizophorae]|uniref:Uncharacterized protein n=1 Tax=Lineolata rhizophorae TaxID=578093 RepID=A0A6A6NQ56_9PEZI|nr:hypothetical protein BDY21DRAFT_354389 [Lineolata rhizophorae]
MAEAVGRTGRWTWAIDTLFFAIHLVLYASFRVLCLSAGVTSWRRDWTRRSGSVGVACLVDFACAVPYLHGVLTAARSR